MSTTKPCAPIDNAVPLDRPTTHPVGQWRTPPDVLVYGLILGLGALQLGLSLRADDFFRGDTAYFELARSLAEGGYYGFNFRPQTLIPPGLPVIMALLCVLGACRYVVFLHSMAVFATMGLIVSYELLRREHGRAVAAGVCLLLGSSPIFFAFSTQMVFSDMPYLFTSMLTLLLATRLDSATSVRARVVLGPLCGLLLVSSLLIRSAGITLVTGLVAWLAASWLTDRQVARRRTSTFLPLVVVGIVVQIAWMSWVATHEVVDWPLGGYPRSYVAQLSVKSGNYPELGAASLGDIPSRMSQHGVDRAAALVALLTRKDYINPSWSSPLIIGPVVLILIGVGRSLWRGGGSLPAWYFIGHEAMYLLWPWDFEIRFFLPVAPLAGLYLWRGGEALLGLAARKPRAVVAGTAGVATVLAAYAGVVAGQSAGVQLRLAVVFWAVLALVCIGVASIDSDQRRALLSRLLARERTALFKRQGSLPAVRAFGWVTVAGLVGLGIVQQVGIGRDNLSFDITKESWYADIEAAKWIDAHTATSTVVMARQVDAVYHYARRKVVWFPPLSDPQRLMEGIQRHRVEFVIVHRRETTYWWPPEEICFEALSRAYPEAFRLVHEGPRFSIFEALTARADG
jgi:hypothetical protein